MHDADAVLGAQCRVVMRDVVHRLEAGQHVVAERTGVEGLERFDERHLDGRIKRPDVPGGGGSAKTAADNHDAALAGRCRRAGREANR